MFINLLIYIFSSGSVLVGNGESKGVEIMNKELNLSDAAKRARAEYMREWRKANPEKVKQNNKSYWERRAREMQQKDEQQA